MTLSSSVFIVYTSVTLSLIHMSQFYVVFYLHALNSDFVSLLALQRKKMGFDSHTCTGEDSIRATSGEWSGGGEMFRAL